MSFEIKDVAESGCVYWLNHADSGVGKTDLIGQMGRMGLKVLLMRSPIDHVDSILGSGVKEVIVRNHEDLLEVLDYLRMEGQNWDWVWWDSISLTQDVMLDDVYQTMLDRHGDKTNEKRIHRAQFGPDQGEYRTNMFRIEEFVRYAVGAGQFNFGVTAHSFWYTPYGADDTVGPQIWPWVQGKQMPQKVSGAMNVVSYYEAKEVQRGNQKRTQRVIHFNKSEHWYAKCQFKKPDGADAFEDELVAPTVEEILATLASCRLQTNNDRKAGQRRPTGPAPINTRNTGKPNTALVRRTTKKK